MKFIWRILHLRLKCILKSIISFSVFIFKFGEQSVHRSFSSFEWSILLLPYYCCQQRSTSSIRHRANSKKEEKLQSFSQMRGEIEIDPIQLAKMLAKWKKFISAFVVPSSFSISHPHWISFSLAFSMISFFFSPLLNLLCSNYQRKWCKRWNWKTK